MGDSTSVGAESVKYTGTRRLLGQVTLENDLYLDLVFVLARHVTSVGMCCAERTNS